MRAALIAALVSLAGASAAAADTITVVPEPAGANCAAGGVKITVTPTPPAPPAPAPPDQISYVCAGGPGQDGAPGADGQDGAPGQDGIDGQDGQDGQSGADGFDGQNGSSSSSSARAPSCGKASRVVVWHLPARYRHVRSATAVVGGHKRTISVNGGAVSVDLHGLACGSYPIVIQRRGLRPAVRIYTLSSSGRVSSSSVRG